MQDTIQTITIYALPVLLAITLHEAAHGYVARMFGDRTAERAGRISLNPLRHIDPVGTVLVPGAILLLSALGGGGFLFGWAKPVPVNFGNLRRPKQHMIWVAAAGPGVNLLMAVAWAIALRVFAGLGLDEPFFLEMARAGVFVNIGLMALNLLPIPPLDGGRIMTGILPTRMAVRYAGLERWGMVIVLALMATNTLSLFLQPFYRVGMAVVKLFL